MPNFNKYNPAPNREKRIIAAGLAAAIGLVGLTGCSSNEAVAKKSPEATTITTDSATTPEIDPTTPGGKTPEAPATPSQTPDQGTPDPGQTRGDSMPSPSDLGTPVDIPTTPETTTPTNTPEASATETQRENSEIIIDYDLLDPDEWDKKARRAPGDAARENSKQFAFNKFVEDNLPLELRGYIDPLTGAVFAEKSESSDKHVDRLLYKHPDKFIDRQLATESLLMDLANDHSHPDNVDIARNLALLMAPEGGSSPNDDLLATLDAIANGDLRAGNTTISIEDLKVRVDPNHPIKRNTRSLQDASGKSYTLVEYGAEGSDLILTDRYTQAPNNTYVLEDRYIRSKNDPAPSGTGWEWERPGNTGAVESIEPGQ